MKWWMRLALLASMAAGVQQGVLAGDIAVVTASPLYRQPYACSEDWQGRNQGLGEELGQDCWIQEMASGPEGRAWMQAYSGSGRENADWYGWGKDVLSPCQCEVVDQRDNPVVNRPGIPGRPPAAFIKLRRDDGVFFMLTSVTRPRVKPGDRVKPGQILAQVGNNGYASQPQVHIGAWRGKEPLQILFDQQRMADLFEE